MLAIQSGGDTTFKGASGKAEQIIASVGGNLLLESLQDTSKYDAKNQSAGFGASICLTGTCTSNISANAGQGQMKSDFKSVTEQTGLWAGNGGFLIDVKNNTTLIGSVIASSDKAVADGLNKLSTGTLVTEDVKNKASYSAYQVSVGGGIIRAAATRAAARAWARPGQPGRGRREQRGEHLAAVVGQPVVQTAHGRGRQRQRQLDHEQRHQRRHDRDPRRGGPAGADRQDGGGDDRFVEPGYVGYVERA